LTQPYNVIQYGYLFHTLVVIQRTKGAGGTIGPPTAVDRGRKAEKGQYVREEKKTEMQQEETAGSSELFTSGELGFLPLSSTRA
jgi:hypothetical protein